MPDLQIARPGLKVKIEIKASATQKTFQKDLRETNLSETNLSEINLLEAIRVRKQI